MEDNGWAHDIHNTQSVQFQIHTFIYIMNSTHAYRIFWVYTSAPSKNLTDRSSTLYLSFFYHLLCSSLKWGERIAKKISNKRIPFWNWKMLLVVVHDLINAYRNGQFIIKLHPSNCPSLSLSSDDSISSLLLDVH